MADEWIDKFELGEIREQLARFPSVQAVEPQLLTGSAELIARVKSARYAVIDLMKKQQKPGVYRITGDGVDFMTRWSDTTYGNCAECTFVDESLPAYAAVSFLVHEQKTYVST